MRVITLFWTLLCAAVARGAPPEALYGHFMIRRVSGNAGVSMDALCADLDAAGVFHCHFTWRDGAAGKRHVAIESDDELVAAVNAQPSVRAANATFTQVKDQYQLSPVGTYLGRAASWNATASFPHRRLRVLDEYQSDAPSVLRYLNPLFHGGRYYYAAPAVRNVTVYVVDTEIAPSHPEFSDRVKGGSRVRASWWSLSANETTGTACATEHGTHVASIVAGNEHGVCKTAAIVSVAVNAGCGADSRASELVAGLDWILSTLDGAPSVVTISPQAIAGGAGEVVTLMTQQLLDAGVVVVAAAGDTSDVACLYSPSGVPGVLTAAGANMSTLSAGAPSETTNYGSCVGLWAAGVNVSAASALPGMSSVFTGTADAAAAVAGAAAQLIASGLATDSASVTAAMRRFAAEDVLTWNVPQTPRTFAQVPVYGVYGTYGTYGGYGK